MSHSCGRCSGGGELRGRTAWQLRHHLKGLLFKKMMTEKRFARETSKACIFVWNNRKETQKIGRTEAVLSPDGRSRQVEFNTGCDGCSHMEGMWSEQ